MPFPDAADPEAPPSELDRLRVALAVQLTRDIAEADGVLDVAEVEILTRAFPNQWMQRCGFLDERGRLNDAYARCLAQARGELHRRLDLRQKLDLVTLLHDTCMADGELHHFELDLLTEAARRLHIPRDAFRRHMATLDVRGEAPPVRPA